MDKESWCIPARFKRRKRSGLSCDALLTTTTQGSLPGLARARTTSSRSPRAIGSPPDTLTTTGLRSRQIAAYSSGVRRVSLIGPPQLQCQQFAVQAWVTSNETERGYLKAVFHKPLASILIAMPPETFMCQSSAFGSERATVDRDSRGDR